MSTTCSSAGSSALTFSHRARIEPSVSPATSPSIEARSEPMAGSVFALVNGGPLVMTECSEAYSQRDHGGRRGGRGVAPSDRLPGGDENGLGVPGRARLRD